MTGNNTNHSAPNAPTPSPSKEDEHLYAQLSDLIDDQISETDLQALLDTPSNTNLRDEKLDDSIRQTWLRLHTAHHLLHQSSAQLQHESELTSALSTHFADRVASAIADTETHTAKATKQQPKRIWGEGLSSFFNSLTGWQPMAGLASAAVVFVLVLSFNPASVQDNQPTVAYEPTYSGGIESQPVWVQNQAQRLFEQVNLGTQLIPNATQDWAPADINRLATPSLSHVSQFMPSQVPEGFTLVNSQLIQDSDIEQEALFYSNGNEQFTIYIEPLLDRSITQGHAYLGHDIVYGQTLDINNQTLFVTLVGKLNLDNARSVAGSIKRQ